jgi:UDP-glucose 4-epimerase
MSRATGRAVGMPRSVAVIGAGFLGTHLVRGFVRRGADVTLLSRRPLTGGAAQRAAGAEVVIGDAADAGTLHTVLGDVEHVVWAAGGLMPAESNQRPVEDVLATLPPLLLALDRLVARGGGALTLISSGGTVYGNPTIVPVPEHHVTQPLSSHGVGKVASELYLALYHDVYGLDTQALRVANVYGEGQRANRSQGVIATAVDRLRRREPFPLVANGNAVRDFIHVDDMVDVTCTLAGRPDRPIVVNVGSGVGTSIRTVLDVLADVSGRRIETVPLPARPGDVRSVVLDITLLRSLMAFEPVSLVDGLGALWRGLEGAEQLSGQ